MERHVSPWGQNISMTPHNWVAEVEMADFNPSPRCMQWSEGECTGRHRPASDEAGKMGEGGGGDFTGRVCLGSGACRSRLALELQYALLAAGKVMLAATQSGCEEQHANADAALPLLDLAHEHIIGLLTDLEKPTKQSLHLCM